MKVSNEIEVLIVKNQKRFDKTKYLKEKLVRIKNVREKSNTSNILIDMISTPQIPSMNKILNF